MTKFISIHYLKPRQFISTTITIYSLFLLTAHSLHGQVGQIDEIVTMDIIHPSQPATREDVVAAISSVDSSQVAITNEETSDGENGEGSVLDPMNVTPRRVLWTVILCLLAYFVMRYLTDVLEESAKGGPERRLTVSRLIPTLHIVGWTVVIYVVVFEVFKLTGNNLFAVSASAGLAIGFASQDILKNIFGGIMILLDRPFQVGDKIEVGGYYGEVTQIGLRSVRIQTPDDNQVSIPNGEILGNPVSNANAGESNCQVVAEFFLPSHINLVEARKISYRAAAVSRYIYLNKPIELVSKNEVHQGRSLLKIHLKAYVLDVRYEFPFSTEMTEIVIQELLTRGLVMPEELMWGEARMLPTL